jgi:3-hydroxy-9,10-secoandrosta-1,3,5(10)-triene-9,17-dione monooxygenase
MPPGSVEPDDHEPVTSGGNGGEVHEPIPPGGGGAGGGGDAGGCEGEVKSDMGILQRLKRPAHDMGRVSLRVLIVIERGSIRPHAVAVGADKRRHCKSRVSSATRRPVRQETNAPMLTRPEEMTADQLLARTDALRPLLLDEQAATEERGYYSEQIFESLRDIGVYRCLQPKLFGGYEFDLPTFSRMIMSIARGCPSTGWGVCLAAGHAMQIGSLFGYQAQAEVFGDGDFRAPSRGTPLGSAVPTDGGWLINGQWDYCSGAPYSTHFLPVALEPGANGPTPVVAVVPRDQYEVMDDWGDVLGLRGSGSHSIRIVDQHIPDHFVVRRNLVDVDVTVPTPGYEIHGNSMYSGRTLGFFYVEIVSIVVGIAMAAVDEYEQIILTKPTYMPPVVPRYQSSEFLRPFGLAQAMVNAAEATVLRTAQQYMELCERGIKGGTAFQQEEDYALYTTLQQAARFAWEATESLFRFAGTTPAKNGQRMQRYYRDISMSRTQFAANFDRAAEWYARSHFGLPR